jgi:hypothetical protein
MMRSSSPEKSIHAPEKGMQSHLRQAFAYTKINGRRDFQFFVVTFAPAFASALAFSSARCLASACCWIRFLIGSKNASAGRFNFAKTIMISAIRCLKWT